MIKRYEKCIGLSFPSIGKWKIEIWFCRPNYSIRPHMHQHEDIELFLLFGHNVRFHRHEPGKLLGESFFAKFTDMGKRFSIRAGTTHSFDVSNFPLIFLNVEKWLDGIKPTSASEDLQLTTN